MVGDKISNKGFWLTNDESGHCFDDSLAHELKLFFNLVECNNILDLGCGPGHYTKYFIDNKIQCEGWDGNPNTFEISKGLCNVADLTKENDFKTSDWVLSLEVGEHIPKEYESIFINNLVKHAKKGIILSWATPGQPGDGHVNCQSNEYVISILQSHGYYLDIYGTTQLRKSATLWWFQNTIMVFRKKEIPKITFCIPSKNNLRYLKTCISSIRENAFRKDHDIIVFVDSDEDGTVDWLKEIKEKYNLIYYINPELGKKLYGIGKAYDYCIEKSTTDIFMIFHADMMLGEDADLKAYQHLKPKTVVCSTRIEPPLHPNNGEKILLDFGIWPEEFKKEQFNEFVKTQLNTYKVTNGIFAPWMMYKEDFITLGGHDPILASAREDSDVFNRMKLAEYTFIQPWNSLVYHLTGRGGQFQHGIITKEEENKSLEWQQLMINSTKEFIRKWGSSVNHTELMEPIISPKYDIGFIIKNCNQQILSLLEPWCSTMYVDCDYKEYINQEQINTNYDLSERIYPYDNEKQNHILIKFDGNQFNQSSFNLITMLPEIIHQTNDLGSFELDIFTIDIINLTTFENTLIHL